LENFRGFALFVFATLLSSALLWSRCKGLPKNHLPGGWIELVNPGQENLSSFLLAWTLFYGSSSSSTFSISRILTCRSGIVHGEITQPMSPIQEFDADCDAKCMTSRLYTLFICSSPNFDTGRLRLCDPP
jgi:hypothetical protein